MPVVASGNCSGHRTGIPSGEEQFVSGVQLSHWATGICVAKKKVMTKEKSE